jgi:formylglycine-generating enzyme required for sulfatase activity
MAEHAQLATALSHTGTELTAFTPNYGAPEQFSRSHGATGPWTDVFGMALILLEVLRGGEPALSGNDYMQLAVASRDPMTRPTPRTLGLQVPQTVERVFARALAVAPGERFSTMGQFWSALHEAVFPESPAWNPTTVTGRGLPARPMTPPDPSVLAAGMNPASPAPPLGSPLGRAPHTASGGLTASTGKPAGSSGALTAGLGALGALLIGGLGVAGYKLFLAADQPASDPPPAPAMVVSAPSAAVGPIGSAPARGGDCPAGMALVAGGKFFMGSDDASFKLWQPAHKVTLDTFCIDVHEVTVAAYRGCSDLGECKRPEAVPDYPKSEGVTDEQHEQNRKAISEHCNFGKQGRDQHPVNCLSWSLADNFCRVNKKRLPTEAEWEYAARGSDGRRFPWGDDVGDHSYMNACGQECNAWEAKVGMKLSTRMYEADDGWAGTAPVGSFPKGKTRFGTFDVVGNVWEWTADWFETYKAEEAINPKGARAGDRKAIRGGGFNGGVPMWVDPAFRYHQVATASSPGIGFRCAADL